jgi:hypothetical protein
MSQNEREGFMSCIEAIERQHRLGSYRGHLIGVVVKEFAGLMEYHVGEIVLYDPPYPEPGGYLQCRPFIVVERPITDRQREMGLGVGATSNFTTVGTIVGVPQDYVIPYEPPFNPAMS